MPKLNIILTATTPESRAKGLKQVRELGANDGALFIFPKEVRAPFWNLGVNYPIDLGFFDKNKNLIHIDKLDPNQMENIVPPYHYRYVLETTRNWFKENNIALGTSLHNLL